MKLFIDFHIDANFQILYALFRSCISRLNVIYITQFEGFDGEEFSMFIDECSSILKQYYKLNAKIYVSMEMENEEYDYITQWFDAVFASLHFKHQRYIYNQENEEELFLSTINSQSTCNAYKDFLQKLTQFKLFQDVTDI